MFRANEAASQAPIANSNSNHAPRSVRLRTKIKLCADRVETHCPRTWEEVLLHLACHISLRIICILTGRRFIKNRVVEILYLSTLQCHFSPSDYKFKYEMKERIEFWKELKN